MGSTEEYMSKVRIVVFRKQRILSTCAHLAMILLGDESQHKVSVLGLVMQAGVFRRGRSYEFLPEYIECSLLTVPYAPLPSLTGSSWESLVITMSAALISQSLHGRSGSSTLWLEPALLMPADRPETVLATLSARCKRPNWLIILN